MKRLLSVAVVAVLGACGGSGGGGGNAAVNRSFTYGTPTTATSTQTSAVSAQLSSVTAMQGTSFDPAAAASFQSVTGALLGSSIPSIGGTMGRSAALVAGGVQRVGAEIGVATSALTADFDNPTCVQETATSVTFTACSFSGQDAQQGWSMKGLVNGHFTGSAAHDSGNWDVTVTVTITGQNVSGGGSVHYSGDLALTATTIKGAMLLELGVNASGGGQSDGLGVSESLAIDVTYQSSPAVCATGGTIEAKRVWTQRPQGASATQLPDKAAKVTFTGCGAATIQVSG